MAKQRLGKYEILGQLGEGATAVVFRARDTVLGREVALKILKPALVADKTAFLRFAREAQAAALLYHPHIALVLDMDSAGDRHFIVMRYVPGRPLGKLLAEDGALPWAEALRLAEQIGGALAFAHAQGFIHRDVKPANIIRTPEGDYVLTDFGLTRAMMATGLTSHTGAVLGTPAYIPPEIWLGKTATPATDEYALACVLVEALTGEVLFAGETPPAVMTRHVLTGAELPDVWPEGAPEGIGAVFAQALSKAPDERHGGPGALVEVLDVKRETSDVKRETLNVMAPASSIEQPASSNELVLELAQGVTMTFVRIPAGEFLMGKNPPQSVHVDEYWMGKYSVHVDEYWMGKYSVTNAQYAAFVEATGYERPQGDEWSKKGLRLGRGKYPVVNVSMYDADAFCEWASQVTGVEVKLPAEAQWEKAARGTDGREYPWGADEPTPHHCTFNVGRPMPVGSHSPAGDSPYGCADMVGNVWEWCEGAVLRGGSFYDNTYDLRAADRDYYGPDFSSDIIGFRCVAGSPGN